MLQVLPGISYQSYIEKILLYKIVDFTFFVDNYKAVLVVFIR